MFKGLYNLNDIKESKGRDYTLGLFDKFLVVREKLNGTGISFKVNESNKFEFYKTGAPKPLTILDRTLQSIYEYAIQYITSFPIHYFRNNQFDLRYFPNGTSNRPKNGLVLESVRELDSKGNVKGFRESPDILGYFADTMEIEKPPIVYYGRLSKVQKTNLNEWIDNPENIYHDMKKMFGQSELSNGYTFKFLDKLEENVSTRILNPKIKNVKKDSRGSSDTYSIALQDIVEFIQTLNWDQFKVKGEDKEQRILNLLSDIYAKYIAKNGSKYLGMEDLDGPDFSKNIPEFGVNLKYVINKNTKNYLEKSQINKELFKLFLGTFTKKRSKTSVLIDDNTKHQINKIVDMISDRTVDKPETKETVPTFEEYYYDKYQKRALFEAVNEGTAVNLIHKEPGKKPVNIIVGRFQPPTLGHIKLLTQLHSQNSLPCVVIQVRSVSGEKTPFENDLITQIWYAITKQYKYIEAVRETSNGFLFSILNALRPEYEPVLWGTGSDRMKDYERMITKYGEEANVLPDFQPFEVKRTGKDISATAVRDALKEDNEKEFKKLTPKAEHKFYQQLRTELLQAK